MLPTAFYNRRHNFIARSGCRLYLAPHPALRPYVAHYTVLTEDGGKPADGRLTLIPDASGCVVFRDFRGAPGAELWGATTKTVSVQNGADRGNYFFIEFRPGALFPFTGVPQGELTDRRFPLEEVFPFAPVLWQAAARCVDLDGFIQETDRLLLPLFLEKSVPSALRSALERLRRARGIMTMRELSALEFYSERHLNRLFRTHMGMGMKSFSRLLRVNAAAARMDAEKPLTGVAHASGYYDQAHFVHDFQAICGVAPGVYLQNPSDFYKEPFKLL